MPVKYIHHNAFTSFNSFIPLSLCLRLNNFFLLLFLRLFTVFVLFMLIRSATRIGSNVSGLPQGSERMYQVCARIGSNVSGLRKDRIECIRSAQGSDRMYQVCTRICQHLPPRWFSPSPPRSDMTSIKKKARAMILVQKAFFYS